MSYRRRGYKSLLAILVVVSLLFTIGVGAPFVSANNIDGEDAYVNTSEPDTYTVTFEDWDGTELGVETVEPGEGTTAPVDPIREGYVFTGWDTDFANVTEDLTVTAQYIALDYMLTINYVDEDGNALAESYTDEGMNFGNAYTVESPVIDGYELADSDQEIVSGVMPADDVAVTVVYTLNLTEIVDTGELTETVITEGAVEAPDIGIMEAVYPGEYDVADNNLILDVAGSSKNDHTVAVYAWYDEENNFYLAAQSTHELGGVMTINGITSTDTHTYGPLVEIKIESVFYRPDTQVQGNTKDARWTVYVFAGGNIAAGEYTFSITGVGGGHDIEGRKLKISIPKTNIQAKKVWEGGSEPRPAIELQLYRNIEGSEPETVGTPVTLNGTEPDPWCCTWADVDKSTGKGVLYHYTVDETSDLDMYNQVVTGDMTDGFVITNTYAPKIIITANSAEKTYDGTALTDADYTYTEGILAAGDVLTAVVEGSIINAGTADNVVTSYQVMRGETDVTSFYTISTVNGTLTINKKAVTITVDNASKVYGEDDPTFIGTVVGLVGSDDLGTVSYSRIGSDENVGAYIGVLTATYTANPNYEVTVVPGDFTITAASTMTVSAENVVKTYDGNSYGVSATSNVEGATIKYWNEATSAYDLDASPAITNVSDSVLTVKFQASHLNYTTVTGQATVTINPKAVTITVDNASKVYGEDDPTFIGTVVGLVGSDDLGTVSYSRIGSDENVGAYIGVLTATYTANPNYEVTVVPGDFTITAASTMTVSAENVVKTYDGNSYGVSATSNVEGATIKYWNEATSAYDLDASPAITNVSDSVLTVKFQASHLNYTTVTGQATVTINPKAVTITVDNASKVYGEDDPTFIGTVVGLVGSDDLGTVSYSRIGSDENVGAYIGVLTATYAANPNYEVTVVPGDFTITAASTMTVSADNVVKTYDGNSYGVSATSNVADAVIKYWNEATSAYDLDASPAIANVSDSVLTVNFQASHPNYVTVTGQATVTITPKAVTVTVNDAEKVYGTADPAFTGTVEGLVGLGDLGTVSYSRTNTAEGVGLYENVLDATYTPNTNYTVTVVPGDFTITAASTMTVSAENVVKTYDGNSYGVSATSNVEGATIKYWNVATEAYDLDESPAITNVSDSVLTVKFQASHLNYTTVTGQATVTINPKAVTITVDNASKVYGEDDPTFIGTVVGLVGSDDLGTVSYSRIGSDENVGAYIGVLTATYTANPNYEVTVVPGDFTITAASTMTVSADNVVKTYDGNSYGVSATSNVADAVIKYWNEATSAYDLDASPAIANVSDSPLTVNFQASHPNYVTVTGQATVTITTRPVTITGNNSTVTYNGTLQEVDGFTHGELANTTSAVALKAGKAAHAEGLNVGTYYMGLTSEGFLIMDGTEDITQNYAITVTDGWLKIEPAQLALTITGNNSTVTYNGTLQEVDGFTHSELANTTSAVALKAGKAAHAEGLNVGTYYMGLTSEDFLIMDGTEDITQNYAITVTDGWLKIEPATGAELKISDFTGVYDGAAHSISIGNLIDGDTGYYSTDGGETWNLDNPAFTNVGVYPVYVKVTNPNYNDRTGSGTVTINPKAVTIAVNDAEKVYGTADPTFTGTVSGLINANDLGTVSYSRTNTAEGVGLYENVLDATYTSNSNYTVTVEKGNFIITAATGADLNITGYSGVYDGLPHSISVGSLIDGDTVYYSTDSGETWDLDNPAFTNVGEYTVYVKVTNPNYEDRTGSGTVTITPKLVTITVNDAKKVYGEDDPAFTGTVDGLVGSDDLGTVSYSRTNTAEGVGLYENVLTATYMPNSNYTVTVEKGNFTITAATGAELDITGYSGVYDGLAHSISVGSLIDGDTVYYSTDSGETWDLDNPAYTNVGENTVYVKVENPNYEDRTGSGTVEITARPIEITAASATKTYDGTPLIKNDYSLTGGTLADGETITGVTVTGSQKDVGSNANVASAAVIMRGEVEVTDNYAITYKNGTLTVTRKTSSDSDSDDPTEIIIPPSPVPLGPALEKDVHFAYIVGYPDNTVRPQNNITREEVTAVFYRLLEANYRNSIKTTRNNFPDVEAGRWSSCPIGTLANGNIIVGYPDGTFRPGNNITRAEVAVIASKFDKLSPMKNDMFSDVSGHWAEECIYSAANKGWVAGYPDGTFKPDQYITRAEFVTLVNNVLERRVKPEDLLAEARQFPDLKKDAWYYTTMQEAINSHNYLRKDDGYEEWIDICYPILDM